ncbi:MAG: hypothetical protein LBT66_05355 [Methanobrevibacter sp.]|jgi:hypothetical protein|nr:hypothetical protein [Candidatus Methanovirga meridionalis]
MDFPEGSEKCRFNKNINDLFQEYYEGFKEDLIIQNTNNIGSFKENMDITFSNYSKNLDIIINDLKCDNYYEKNKYILFEDLIDKIGIHKSDKLILLDYYELVKNSNQKIGFITQDKDIINHRQNLKRIFNEINCLIFYPNDYIKLTI